MTRKKRKQKTNEWHNTRTHVARWTPNSTLPIGVQNRSKWKVVATVSRLSVTVVTILINVGRTERLGCVHSYRVRATEKAIDELEEQFGPKVFGGVHFQCLVSKPRNHLRHRKNGS